MEKSTVTEFVSEAKLEACDTVEITANTGCQIKKLIMLTISPMKKTSLTFHQNDQIHQLIELKIKLKQSWQQRLSHY